MSPLRRRAPIRATSVLAVTALLALARPQASWPATRHVPGEYPTVRAAVTAAADGDTIILAPGTHPGGVFINGKALTFGSWYLLDGDTAHVATTVVNGVASGTCSGASGCAGNAVFEFGDNAHGSALYGLTVSGGENGVASASVAGIFRCRVVNNGDGVDYVDGSGGTFHRSLFANNSDDGIDLNGRMTIAIVENEIRDNSDDGIEYRLHAYQGPMTTIDILRNRITGNGEDGIQLIDYPDLSSRIIRIERNLFMANYNASGSSAAIGCMANGETVENLSGAAIPERIYVLNNTFIGEKNGVVGGANLVALNNLFVGTQGSAVRRVGGSSIAAYNLFWNNGVDHEESNLDTEQLLYADPLLTPEGGLQPWSPAINAGAAFYAWQGETVLDLPPYAYQGSAPDIGAFDYAGNTAPVVEAGPAAAVFLPSVADLGGSVVDDDLPYPPQLVATWTVVSGPGQVTFGDPQAPATYAGFATPGTYVLRLTADDGELTASDSTVIQVLADPGPLERRIASPGDDGSEGAGGSMSLSESFLDLGAAGQTVALRFTDVTLLRGATIVYAYIQFQASAARGGTSQLLIEGEASDDAAVLTPAVGDVSIRPRTAASAGWSPAAWGAGEAGPAQRTANLAAIVQEIVDRPGWTSGNAMAFFVSGNGPRTASSFEGDPAGAALLRISYLPTVVHAGGSGPPRLALHRAGPHPVRGPLQVEFSLANGEPASLELIDVSGRRLEAREVGSFGAGRHRVALGGRPPVGVYLVRLVQEGHARVMKAVVLR